MSALKVLGIVLTTVAIIGALVIVWTTKGRVDLPARQTRYRMVATIMLCGIVPARVLLEDRLTIIPWVLLLVILVGGGFYFFRKAGRV